MFRLSDYSDDEIKDRVWAIVDEYEDSEGNWPCYEINSDEQQKLVQYIIELRDKLKVLYGMGIS